MTRAPTTIAILIGTPAGARLLAAASEREAAQAAERLLLRLPGRALPVPLWVQCADAGARARLTHYLEGFQAERVRERGGVEGA